MNIVQIGGRPMNKSVTSREHLLAAAKELAYGQGLTAVNIRAVAANCGVAVGSIYNYFPTKADLIAAVIEDFWRQATHMETCLPGPGESFPVYVSRLYEMLSHDLSAFQSGFLRQMAALSATERQKGRELEGKCFDHIKQGLLHALAACGASSSLLAGESDQAAFVDFVFRNMMLLLRQGAPDCAYFQRILEKILSF